MYIFYPYASQTKKGVDFSRNKSYVLTSIFEFVIQLLIISII